MRAFKEKTSVLRQILRISVQAFGGSGSILPMHEDRYGWFSTPDEQKAIKWYHWAAERGSCWAQHVLGDIYNYGFLNLEKDKAEAMKWYLRASEHDTTDGCKLWSIKNIGDMYYYGVGITRDIEEGVKWHRRAAWGGWTRSQLELGVMLRDGTNVRKDYTEALMLFRMAAEGGTDGDPNGKLYMRCTNVPTTTTTVPRIRNGIVLANPSTDMTAAVKRRIRCKQQRAESVLQQKVKPVSQSRQKIGLAHICG